MHTLDPLYQQNLYIFDDNSDGMTITYASSDYDDLLGSQTQQSDAAGARQYIQDQFRIVAENLQDTGNVLYLFC